MNDATKLIRLLYRFGEPGKLDVIGASTRTGGTMEHLHPEIIFSAYDIHGTRRHGVGREAFREFVAECAAAVGERHDEILSIDGVGDQMTIVHARAFRRNAVTAEQITYEWIMVYRVEDGLITVAADMLDRRAADFWTRVAQNVKFRQ